MANQQFRKDVAAVEKSLLVGTDPKDKRSADNEAMLPYWQQVADIRGGIRSMKVAGDTYLKKFPEEPKEDYEYRLSLAKLTNVYKDVSDSLAAKPFQEEIGLKPENETDIMPEQLDDLEDNVDGAGNNLTKFAAQVFSYGINNAIHWVFVDMPKIGDEIRTIADGKAANIRPYWSHVLAQNMLEVKAEFVNAKAILTYARILEPGKPKTVREFTRDSETGVITWIVYEQNDKGEWPEKDSGILGIDQIPLFPFITGEREGKTWVFIPPLQDACDLQIILYRQESQLEFAKTMTAYPMLSGNGVKPAKNAQGMPEKLAIGPNRVLYAPPDGNGNSGNWAYVEPSASSLTFLSADVDKTKQDLRELGKQPLTATTGGLTVITTAVAAGKAKSAVKAWGLALKDTLENCIECSFKWLKIDTKLAPDVVVYDDYDNVTEGDIEALTAARASRDISGETFTSELKRRAILSAEFDFDNEQERLLKETLPPAGSVDDSGGGDTMPGGNDTLPGNDTLNPAD